MATYKTECTEPVLVKRIVDDSGRVYRVGATYHRAREAELARLKAAQRQMAEQELAERQGEPGA